MAAPVRSPALLLLLVLGLTPIGVKAEPWTAQVGWGGTVVPGHWAPLRLDVPSVTGPWLLAVGESSVWDFPGPGVFERPVFVPAGQDSLALRRSEHGFVLDEKDLPIGATGFPGHILVVDGVDARLRSSLAGLLLPTEPLRVVQVSPENWPASFLSWDAVSALVVEDPGPVLAPAQVGALRAWWASGGVMALLGRKSPSLLDQIGAPPGLGRLVFDPAQLGLAPYGTRSRPGTDFEPPARGTSDPGPRSLAAVVLLGIWALAWVLVSRRKAAWGTGIVLTVVASLAVLGLWGWGGLPWDRGVRVHARQVIFPEAGAVTSVDATASTEKVPAVDWPESPPQSLELWKAQWATSKAGIRVSTADRVVLESFGPAPARSSPFAVRWMNASLVWTHDGTPTTLPSEFAPDVPWISRVASFAPGSEWRVGLAEGEGGEALCWMRVADKEGRS